MDEESQQIITEQQFQTQVTVKRCDPSRGRRATFNMLGHNRRARFGAGGFAFILLLLVVVFLTGPTTFRAESELSASARKRLLSDPHVDCQPKCKIPGLISGRQFYDYFTVVDYKCTDMRWFGSEDGRKAVCVDPAFNMVPSDCHILSFGINNEWSFDDAFGRLGCKVYAFDPTMGKEDHQRSPNIQFFNLGIGNIEGKRKVGMSEKFAFFQVDRYENILARLNLTNTTIDYLKMDVELSEIDFFQDVFRNSPHLLKNIRQIGMELHHGYFGEGLGKKMDKRNDMSPTSTFQLFWQYFHELKCHGFKLIHARKNTPWTEVVWGRPQ